MALADIESPKPLHGKRQCTSPRHVILDFLISILLLTMTVNLAHAEECLDLHTNRSVADIFSWPASDLVIETIKEILAVSDDPAMQVEIRPADIRGPAAAICNGRATILYGDGFLADIWSRDSAEWGMRLMFAHEIAHHQKNHLVDPMNRPRQEIEADTFAGRIICLLGGNRSDATALIWAMESSQLDGYHPNSNERESAILRGWWEAQARERSCQRPTMTGRTSSLSINETNVSRYLNGELLTEGEIYFDDVDFRSRSPLVIFANRIIFKNTKIQAPRIYIITGEVDGKNGRLSADGGPGENGGEMLIAATRISGVVLSAQGGGGLDGEDGARPGRDGRDGEAGRDGRCSPSDLVPATPGGAGENGDDGEDGQDGGDGGNGGIILALTGGPGGIIHRVFAGRGGAQGKGSPGGKPGKGGRGGKGCGSHPDQPDGFGGRVGRKGRDGTMGRRGKTGLFESHPLVKGELLKLVTRRHRILNDVVCELLKRQSASIYLSDCRKE